MCVVVYVSATCITYIAIERFLINIVTIVTAIITRILVASKREGNTLATVTAITPSPIVNDVTKDGDCMTPLRNTNIIDATIDIFRSAGVKYHNDADDAAHRKFIDKQNRTDDANFVTNNNIVENSEVTHSTEGIDDIEVLQCLDRCSTVMRNIQLAVNRMCQSVIPM